MCGIAGFLSPRTGAAPEPMGSTIRAMTDCLRHRGPDDEGMLARRRRRHRAGPSPAVDRRPFARRASADDRPPMAASSSPSTARSTVIARCAASSKRAAIAFRGHSDTEVMLESFAAIRHRGDAATADRHVRLALWDRRERTPHAGARSARHQAALLALRRRPVHLRVGTQGAARAIPGWTPANRSRRGRVVPAAQLRAGAAFDLSRRAEARARLHAHACRGGKSRRLRAYWDARAVARRRQCSSARRCPRTN